MFYAESGARIAKYEIHADSSRGHRLHDGLCPVEYSERIEYATVMGLGTVHTDPEHPQAKEFYNDGYAAFFWPDFPRDFVMIEVVPLWLEYLGPRFPGHPQTGRPQGVVFTGPAVDIFLR